MTDYEMIRRTRLLLMLSLCALLPHTKVHAQQPPATSKGCEQINTDKQNMSMHTHKNLRNVGWAEVILWCGNGGTFNTMGENQPKDSAPPNLFGRLNKETLAKEYGIKYASLNPDTGRKFWTLDEFDINESDTVRDFHGLKARYAGEVQARPDGSPQNLTAAMIPLAMYKELAFKRVSKIVFQAGKPIFLLEDPTGKIWINKAYQNGVDATLTYEGMSHLDQHLKHLPAGWKFRTTVLTRDLVINANGVQPIMWDELGDAYDLLIKEYVNYMP